MEQLQLWFEENEVFFGSYFRELKSCFERYPSLLKLLLKDQTTKQNIRWARKVDFHDQETDSFHQPITLDQVQRDSYRLFQPSFLKCHKPKENEKSSETFREPRIPIWMETLQIDLLDDLEIGKIKEDSKKHKSSIKRDQDWKAYVQEVRLVMNCEEGLYFTQGYNPQTGHLIPLEKRQGLLDRKLHCINEHVNKERSWIRWVYKAYRSLYGFTLDGVSLFLARLNLFHAFLEAMIQRFGHLPSLEQLTKVATILSWNLWQMDPWTLGDPEEKACQIVNWATLNHKKFQTLPFSSLLSNQEFKEKEAFSFQGIVGSIPWFSIEKRKEEVQEDQELLSSSAYGIALNRLAWALSPQALSFLTSAKWYSGGKGLTNYRASLLNDHHLHTLYDFPRASDLFDSWTSTFLSGFSLFLWTQEPVEKCRVIHLFNPSTEFDEKIGLAQDRIPFFSSKQWSILERNLSLYPVFIRSNQAYLIADKILKLENKGTLSKRVYPRNVFGLSTNTFPKATGISCHFIHQQYFVERDEVKDPFYLLQKWKVLLPKSPLSSQTDFTNPLELYSSQNLWIAKPGTCCTDSFLVVGAFDTQEEAQCFQSYLLTKTVRFLLVQAMNSSDISRQKFLFIPDIGPYDHFYTDEELQTRWNLTQEEWTYIDSKIRNEPRVDFSNVRLF